MRKRRFLILTASIGAGHTKAAQAVGEAILANHPTSVVDIVDWSDRAVSPANWLTKELYLTMLAVVPNLYDVFYKLSAQNFGGALAQQLNERLMYRTINRVLTDFDPDAVICTHPFPAGATAAVKKHGGKFLSATVMTDYTLHKMWVNEGTDLFFVATEQMRDELLGIGFLPQQVFACGIPIRRAFIDLPPKDTIRKKMGIATDGKTLLMMGGGLGLGSIENTVDELDSSIDRSLDIFVIAGRNEGLKERITKKAHTVRHNLHAMGYIHDTAPFMQAADAIITKPGALTVSEAFAVGLPLILREPIPGPETQNARHAINNGAAIWASENIGQTVEQIIFNDEKLLAMRKAGLSLARPNAANEIAEKIYDSL